MEGVSFVLVSEKVWNMSHWLVWRVRHYLFLPSCRNPDACGLNTADLWSLLLFILADGVWWLGCPLDCFEKSVKAYQRQLHKGCKTHPPWRWVVPSNKQREFGIKGEEGGWMPASTGSPEAALLVLDSSWYYGIFPYTRATVIEPMNRRWRPLKLWARRQTTTKSKQNKKQRTTLSSP